MKILYLSAATIPSRTANSVHVMKMCQAFARNGHRVLLLVPDREQTEAGVDDPFGFYGVEPGFELERLRKKRFVRRRSIIASRLTRAGSDLIYARDHSLRFDLDALGPAVVLDAHKLVTDRNAERFVKLVRSGKLRRLVANCGALGREYECGFDIPGELIRVAHNGANEPADTEPLELGSPGKLRVGYVGQLYEGRGVETIARIAARCPWADFHLIGGTESDLGRWKDELAGRDNVFFHGFRPPAETDRYRQSMDVLLAPYQRVIRTAGGGTTDLRWMSPIKLFEYMAAGKAIIASDMEVIREVLTDRVTARLCPPEDPESWIAALGRLRDDAELRAALGRSAQETFRAKHTWRARAETVLEGL